MQDIQEIHLIKVPTPFPVGAVNCYLIEGTPLTLIDTGVKSSIALKQLENGLREVGQSISDIEQICITHGHVDHIGLVRTIVDQSDFTVDVWIHERDAKRLTEYEDYIVDRVQAYQRIATQSGAPVDGLLGPRETLTEYFMKFGESVKEVKYATEEQKIETGQGHLRVIWTPGHSLGSLCYVLDEPHVVFTGDHILGDISSNPSLDFEGAMGISLLNYLDSLEKVRGLSGYLAFPGHRKLISNIEGRIDTLLKDYDVKMHHVRQVLSSTPISIYDLSRMLYGEYDANQLILALAETLDLVKVLQERGEGKLEFINGVYFARK